MTKEEKIKVFLDWQEKVNAYHMALTIIGVDGNDNPPSDGASYRNEHRAILAGESFRIENDENIYQLLKELQKEELDGDWQRIIELHLKKFERTLAVPQDVYVAYQRALGESENAWLKYKKENDYASYAPYLKELITKYQELISYQNSPLSLYDRMLDQHQNGWTIEKYDAFFEQVKARCVPLIQEIMKKEPIDQSFLFAYYPASQQRTFIQQIIDYIGFTPNWGKLGESEHPLTTSICQNDVRFTTKYREHNIAMAILSSIHEVGHAYFGHQVDPKYEGTIIAHSINAGLHESQSRLCENHLGRSYEFWQVHYPNLQKAFPQQLESISLEQFWRGLNASKPSLIRTDADELTYPLHIMIRYEMERDLFQGKLAIDDLEKVWNQKYKEYLGIEVPDASRGILQDMHWPYAYFGYFPTYALGSAFATQFYHAMAKEIPVSKYLLERKYPEIMLWLKEHVHQYANRYTPDEIMKMATGEEFNPDYYLTYLEQKYRNLYHL